MFLVLGGTWLEAAQSHCFPCILCCFLSQCKAGMLPWPFLILRQELLWVVRQPEIMRVGNIFQVESLF